MATEKWAKQIITFTAWLKQHRSERRPGHLAVAVCVCVSRVALPASENRSRNTNMFDATSAAGKHMIVPIMEKRMGLGGSRESDMYIHCVLELCDCAINVSVHCAVV